MSVYSLDSLENERTSTLKIPDSLELCTGGSNETAEVARVNRSSSKNAIIASGENSAAAARQKEIQHQLPASGIPRKKLASAAPPPAAAAASRRLSGQNKRPESYLELYRRRFSAEASSSPEAAGLSICGDSSGRLHDAGAEEDVSRDDRSELSFYRRLLDETEAEAYQRRTSRDATCFRPYTIEDYRIIRATSAKLDRSLGPDREDVCAKRHPNKEKRLHDVSVATVQGPQSRRALEITEEPSSSSGVSKLGCRPWNLSLISVIVLGLSNMLLTFLLLQSETCGRSSSLARLLADPDGNDEVLAGNKDDPQAASLPGGPCVPTTTQERSQPEQAPGPMDDSSTGFLNLDIRLGRWDSRRLYRMFDSVMTGSRFVELSESSRVCLATQTSLEKLSSLVQVVHQWTGTISVALYAAGDEEFEVLQRYLEYMRHCYEPIRERVTFSLAVPRNRPPRAQPRYYPPDGLLDCQKPEGTLNQMTRAISNEQTNWRIRNVYPQNHMRNLARKNCQTDYVFLTDVDIVPSTNLSRVLDEFLGQEKCDKCAYVIPTYELDARVRFPQNKSELIRLAKKGLARPFHQKVFIHNQFATNFTRWMLDATPGYKAHENLKMGKAYVSHDVTNFEFLYEPFYVARDLVPPHDERFMGYGYTRNTQVYEMYVAGYKFKVLSPTFTVHWGLQTRKSRPAWRERQNSVNRKHFEVFKKEVFARYMRDPLKMLKNPN
ncbi:uncharacterized protein LOC100114967 isoform X3 [Nasonia vitripennis]|uniref:Beta-1,4-glucuronyltransferase 1 n=1 Tax=Nasonia vitripennis TaxID=7425 RepID=A0A7M7LUB6_NASVI|nr:uncharacterized protein LOC100114967 isoform X3 [Nasonia vitripennis]